MEPILEALRVATRDLHAALDQSVVPLDSVENYRSFLRGSLLAVAPLEVQLERWLAPGARWVARAPLLRADLSDLGETADTIAPQRTLTIASSGEAFGLRYVIEGSALGGAVLARNVEQALGKDAPTRYLTVHGSELGSRWRAFMSELNEWDKTATSAEKSQACDTAGAVFACYREAFERSSALLLAPP